MSTERRAARLTTSGVAAIGAAAIAVAACNGRTSYLDATGAPGRPEAVLGAWLTGVASVVVLAVCVVILAAIARHRAARDDRAAGGAATGGATERRALRSGLGWIYVGTGVTVAILCATFVGTVATLNAASRAPRAPSLEMDVIGHQWWWEVRYADPARPDLGFTTANEVHLPIGVPVRVRLRSADVIHSFWLPQIAGKTDIVPGQVNETWVEARRPGTSRGMCGEYCGLQHAVMALAVTAEPRAAFDRWAQARRAEAAAPGTPDARAGRVVFARTCGVCHAVAGTMALGRAGPDLTHVASRPWIGAGALENTPANLARWIHDAPAVKEGARMPAMPLDASELRAVVAYLETLR